jgi:uncharacterized membrane protein YfcA
VFGLSEFDLVSLLLVVGIVAFGGLVKGLAGFGYGIAGTALLAMVLEPATAVVVMILPTLTANLSLLRELDRESIRSCLISFGPYLGAALVGTLTGMALLESIPQQMLALALGLLTLGYTITKQSSVTVPGRGRFDAFCRLPGPSVKMTVGFVSGAIFGASNVGVQMVAYLDTLDLKRATFVGVLAMILVGVSGARIAAAFGLGLYGSGALSLSVLAVVPGLVGVAIGGVGRTYISEQYLQLGTIALLVVIGVRLTTKGFGL